MSYQNPWQSSYGGEAPSSRGNSASNGSDIYMSGSAVISSSNTQPQPIEKQKKNPSDTNQTNSSTSSNGYTQPYVVPGRMQPNAVMMMNSQQLMSGIIPFNVMMPPNFTLDTSKNIKKPKKRRKKDKNKPKRPLSAYNLFFKDEREKILNQIPKDSKVEVLDERFTWPGKKRPPHGKISFEELARTIGARWQNLDEEKKLHYKKMAEEDLERYASEMKIYDKKNKETFKTPLSDDEEIEDDTKRSREETKPPASESKRKKTRKLSKDIKEDPAYKQNTVQDNMGNMVAMNMAGNYMFPMMFDPRSGQPMDKLDMLQAQQQILSNQIAQETERRRKAEHLRSRAQDPNFPKNEYLGMQRDHSYGQHQRFGQENDDLNPISPAHHSSQHYINLPHSFDQGTPGHHGMFQNYMGNGYPQGENELNDNFPSVQNDHNPNDFPFPPPDDPFFEEQTD